MRSEGFGPLGAHAQKGERERKRSETVEWKGKKTKM
jgi:hypothetical protein